MHLSRMELFFSKYTNSYVHIYKVAPTADTTVVSKVEGIEPKFNWASKSETSATLDLGGKSPGNSRIKFPATREAKVFEKRDR